MRLAVIADVHGNLPALETVLDDVRRRGADLVVNLGDCCTAPLWPRETLDLLRALGVPTVRGNHDRWIAEPPDAPSAVIAFTRDALREADRAYLGALPATLAPADGVLAVHGTPSSDTAYLLEDVVDHRVRYAAPAALDERLAGVDASLVLCGHSHQPRVAHASGGRLVLNPGSVGCPRAAGNADARENEAGSPHARYAIATRRGGRWSVEALALAYDWDVVAARARAEGHDDWARAFLGAWE